MESLITKLTILIFLMVHLSRFTMTAKFGEDTETLELLAILHRHGQRTPSQIYKNDPYKDEEKYWPIGLGQLTNIGKLQLYNLGKLFRKGYKTFISSYSVKAVRANSSDYDRTHMSAQCLLAGWFPPEGDEVWNNDLLWQPVPIHSVPINEDQILAPLAPCPNYWMEREKIMIDLANNETAKDKELYQYLTEKSGENICTLDDLAVLYTTLEIEELNGFTLPEWTKLVYPEQMREKAVLVAKSFTWNRILKRYFGGLMISSHKLQACASLGNGIYLAYEKCHAWLGFKAGPMIKEILFQFKEKSEGRNKGKKLFLYSAHDTTILSFLRALNFENPVYPAFGASVIVELHRINDKYFVKLFYTYSHKVLPSELKIPNCSSPCTLDKMLKVTEYVRSVDWDKQCFE